MTQLFDVRQVKKVSLPSYPDVEIELFDGLLTDQVGVVSKIDNDYDRGVEVLRFLIKSWSFVDDKEAPLAITKANIGKLPARDFTFLMDALTQSLDFLGEQKKKS